MSSLGPQTASEAHAQTCTTLPSLSTAKPLGQRCKSAPAQLCGYTCRRTSLLAVRKRHAAIMLWQLRFIIEAIRLHVGLRRGHRLILWGEWHDGVRRRHAFRYQMRMCWTVLFVKGWSRACYPVSPRSSVSDILLGSGCRADHLQGPQSSPASDAVRVEGRSFSCETVSSECSYVAARNPSCSACFARLGAVTYQGLASRAHQLRVCICDWYCLASPLLFSLPRSPDPSQTRPAERTCLAGVCR